MSQYIKIFSICIFLLNGCFWGSAVTLNSNALGQYVDQPSINKFHKISEDFINRLEKYYIDHSQHASNSGEKRFSDLGLDPAYWINNSFDGVIYNPTGNRLEITPAEGYTFFVQDPTGLTRILSHDLKWSLIFNLRDRRWYFHRITPDLIVDITTIRIKKDSPYNIEEYQKYQ